MKKSIYALFLLSIMFLGMLQTNICLAQAQPENLNAFRIIRQVVDSGASALTYSFPVNSSKMKEIGFTEQEIELYKFYLSLYVNTISQNSKDRAVDGVTVSNCVYFEDLDGIGFTITFDSLQVQNQYFGVEDSPSSANTTSKGFFVKTTTIQTTFPVSTQKVASDLKMVCLMAISSWSDTSQLSDDKKILAQELLKDSVYVYDFATQQKNLRSSYMYADEIFYHNVFVKSYEDLAQDNKIVFYIKTDNKPVWYLSALFVVILVMCIAFFINKKKKNK